MMPFFFSKLKQFFLWFKQKAPQYNLVFENVGTGLLGMWVSDANSSESRKRHPEHQYGLEHSYRASIEQNISK